jgi:hypothetical protein
MEGASRTRLVALAVLLAVSVPLVVIAAAGGGSGDGAGTGLRVEPSPQGLPILVIYLEDAEDNRPETNHGGRRVAIECLDDSDEVVFTGEKAWPFTDTDGGTLNPHVHMAVRPAAAIERIVRCRLRGTDPALEGRKA